MNNAELYRKKKALQQNDAKYVIETFLKFLKWKSMQNTILDIGSGDGNTLCEVLLPKIKDKILKTIGVDILSDMVNYSRKHYGSENVIFDEMDIAAVDISVEFFEKFDHIFSFFCLHWVLQQSQAFKNIFEMLKPGGYLLVAFLAKNPIYDIYVQLAKMDKWRRYMKDYKKYISPYHYSSDPALELRNLMKKTGFQIEICKTEKRSFTYPNINTAKENAKAVNPFIMKIPEDKHAEYFEDYTSIMRKVNSVKVERTNNNDEESVLLTYQLLIAVAYKADSVK